MNKNSECQVLTAELLRQLLDYDPTTGVFTWKITRNSRLKVGDVAGSVRPNGYVNLGVAGKLYLAHRLAWMYVHGEWPAGEMDHINRVRNDNRIANLRIVTRSQNCHNSFQHKRNLSGCTGVSFDLKACKWHARIYRNGKTKNLGYFVHLADAIAARKVAEQTSLS